MRSPSVHRLPRPLIGCHARAILQGTQPINGERTPTMWRTYLRPTTLTEALDLLDAHAGQARLIAGGTDVLVELSRGVRPTETLIDLTAIPDLRYVTADGDHI